MSDSSSQPSLPDHVITCVYCGQAYPENTPTHGADVAVLTEHISKCVKHPMRAVIRERDALRALVKRCRRNLVNPYGPETGKKALLVAIDALISPEN